MREREPRNYTLWDTVNSAVRWTAGGLVLTTTTVVIVVASFFVSPFKLDPLLHLMCRLLILCTGVKLRIHGREKLDPKKAYLVVFNHFNMMDHFFVYFALKLKLRGVEKENHFKWPVYGTFAKRVGLIPIAPRGKTQEAIRSLEKLKEYFRQGVSIVVVPEGTRTWDGKLQPFKKGAFHLAIETGATIAPITQIGAYEFMRKGEWRIKPGLIDLYFEDPVPTEGLTLAQVGELSDRVRGVIVKRLDGVAGLR